MNSEDYKHELEFWKNYIFEGKNFLHQKYYTEFFPFDEVSGNILEIGCGGAPFYKYCNKEYDQSKITLVDPILKDLVILEKYFYLKQNIIEEKNFLGMEEEKKYDYIICLNVIDHFPSDQDKFILKIKNMLSDGGKLFLYYDIRKHYSLNHYPVNLESVESTINSNFKILKEDFTVNPVHLNWSTVYSSHRLIAENK